GCRFTGLNANDTTTYASPAMTAMATGTIRMLLTPNVSASCPVRMTTSAGGPTGESWSTDAPVIAVVSSPNGHGRLECSAIVRPSNPPVAHAPGSPNPFSGGPSS